MTARGNFLYNSSSHTWNLTYDLWLLWAMSLYNSLSNSLKYDTWLLGAISFTIPYQNHWNITYDCNWQLPLQFLIQIDEIWLMTARGRFLYNSLSKSLQDYLWLLGAINMNYDSYEPFPLQFLIKIIEISYDSYGQFPLQFLIKIIEIWHVKAMGQFNYNSVSQSLKYELWQLWTISITIPH